MDQETILEIAHTVTKIKHWPYLDFCHYILVAVAIREDLPGRDGTPNSAIHVFSRKHPFACWFSTMVSCFAGAIIANFLLGEPLIAPFKANEEIAAATIVWYLIFYSPFDIVYKLVKFLPIKLAICLAKEILRAYKVHDGVKTALKKFGSAYLVIVAVGVAKGNGAYLLRSADRLIRGIWTPGSHEILSPTFGTKACVLASVVWIIEKRTDLIPLPPALVYLGIVIFFMYFKFSSLILSIHDPLAPFENLFCAIFMGGLVDAFRQAITSSKETMKPKGENDTKDKNHQKKD